jgi:hypothetical protein
MVAVFLGSLFLMASITWLLWSALSPQALWQRRDVLFQICYGMYGFMDLVCVGERPLVEPLFECHMSSRAVVLKLDLLVYPLVLVFSVNMNIKSLLKFLCETWACALCNCWVKTF